MRWLLLILFFPCLSYGLTVDTIKGTTNSFDLTIRELNPTYNYGGSTSLTCQATGGAQRRIVFYTADLAPLLDLTVDSPMVSAVLQFYATSQVGATISCSEMLKPSKEGANDHTTAANQTTAWNTWDYPDTGWSVAGASNAGTIDANHGQTRSNWLNFTTGAHNPSSNTGWSTGGGNIYTSNNSYGRLYNNVVNNLADVAGFSFTTPTGAVFDSIFVTVEGYYIEAGLPSGRLRLKRITTMIGDSVDYSAVLTTSDAVHSFGVNRTTAPTTPLWNTTWVSAQVNNSSTGLRLTRDVETDTINVDHVTMEFKYHADTCLDRSSTAMSSTVVNATGQYFSWAIDTALIRAWDAGTKAEFGVILIETSAAGLTTFTSSEGTAGQEPLLIITYGAPAESGGGRRRRILLEGE